MRVRGIRVISPVRRTGEITRIARTRIGALLHIDESYSDCLPEEKLSWIEYSQERTCPGLHDRGWNRPMPHL